MADWMPKSAVPVSDEPPAGDWLPKSAVPIKGFDPDAYLAQPVTQPPKGFDPDAYLAQRIDWASPKTEGNAADGGGGIIDRQGFHAERILPTLQAAAEGLAHGISSGTGPLSRLMKKSLLYPGELEELERNYQESGAEHPTVSAVGNFAGEAYTPEMAIAGQALGTGLGVAAKSVAGPVGRALEKLGIGQGRRVLTGGANPLSVKVPVSPEAVRSAFDVGAIAPGRTTQYAADTLGTAREKAGEALKDILRSLEDAGVKGPPVEPLAKTLESRAASVAQDTVDSEAPDLYRRVANELRSKASSGHLGLTQGEAIKRSVQGKIPYDALRKATDLVGARKDIASILRQASEDAVAQGANAKPSLSDIASKFIPAKQAAGNLIEASEAATKGAAQAARRNVFSLRDMLAASGLSAGGGAAFGPAGIALGPLGAAASHLASTRGTPTAAWAAYHLGKGLAPAAEGRVGALAPGAAPSIFTAAQRVLSRNETHPAMADANPGEEAERAAREERAAR